MNKVRVEVFYQDNAFAIYPYRQMRDGRVDSH